MNKLYLYITFLKLMTKLIGPLLGRPEITSSLKLVKRSRTCTSACQPRCTKSTLGQNDSFLYCRGSWPSRSFHSPGSFRPFRRPPGTLWRSLCLRLSFRIWSLPHSRRSAVLGELRHQEPEPCWWDRREGFADLFLFLCSYLRRGNKINTWGLIPCLCLCLCSSCACACARKSTVTKNQTFIIPSSDITRTDVNPP